MTVQHDYLERVYAGVLGKLIGVYLGRPFEGWTYERIAEELGQIEYYVHDRLGQPLVVTDDDVAGTFTFVRALEDYGISPDLTAEDIGKAWLNYICEGRSILWWGGNGNSTEHTAWLNLRKGIAAPQSGSAHTNGQTVAEQIGAQIFIDGWALVAPGQPHLAARLAEQAGKVSHDGEAVYAAMLWAAMEAEAFRTKDIDTLLDVGLSVIPKTSLISTLVADIRRWHAQHADWRVCRQLIEDHYGYDKYPGNCHVVPNHALMIMSVLYAPDDFQRAQMIVNTSGWDTDCNAGNVGCLLGIMLGLEGLGAGPDWRGPIADRMLISSADGGNSINDAVRVAYYLVNLGRQLAGDEALDLPKNAAPFHFSLPGSQQGFRAQQIAGTDTRPTVSNVDFEDGRALSLAFAALGPGQTAVATTPSFSPPEVLAMRTYELMASPLLYPGQTLSARIIAPLTNDGAIKVSLRLRVYDANDALRDIDGDATELQPGEEAVLNWRLPQCNGQPIAEIGIVVAAVDRRATGSVLLDYMRWDGAPDVTLRPQDSGQFWRMAWVNGVDLFSQHFTSTLRISHASGEGMISQGTRQWTDYAVRCKVAVHLGNYGGVAVRVQGLRRYYGVRITRSNTLEIVRVRDAEVTVLASADFPFALEQNVDIEVTVAGDTISATVDGRSITTTDRSDHALHNGGIGLVIHEGALSTDAVHIAAA